MTQLRVPPITLDALQQMAVQAGDGPVLVEGGHGSGKTHAVVARIGILLDRGVPPDDIACITGTLHGTADLRRRLAEFSKTQEVYDSMFIGTMVDLALLLLRSHGIQVGQSPDPFTVRNRRQAAAAFYDVAREAHRTRGKALKEQKLKPGQLERAWRWYQMNRTRHADSPLLPALPWWADARNNYDEEKAFEGVLDVLDLVPVALRIMDRQEDIQQSWQTMYTHFLVDDFQNLSAAETDLLMALTLPARAVTATASPNERIGFATDPEFWVRLGLEMDPRGQRRHHLRVQHGSTALLAQAGFAMAAHPSMTGLTDDELTPLRIPGERAVLMEYDGLPQDMYRQVIALLRRIHDDEGYAWRDMACIYPHPLFHRLRTMVISEQIPYTVLGERVPRDADVESVIAMLSLVLNPRDFQAFRRAAPVDQSPSRELNATAAAGIRKTALESDGDLVQAAESHLAGHRYDGRVYRDLRYVTEVWRELNGLAAQQPGAAVGLLTQSAAGMLFQHQRRRLEGAPTRQMSNLLQIAAHWQAVVDDPLRELGRFLDFLNIEPAIDPLGRERNVPCGPDDAVVFGTIDAFAGLCAGMVVVLDARDDVMPGQVHPGDAERLHAEQRRFHVACTRASTRLVLCYATRSGSKRASRPTRFLDHLGNDLLSRVAAPLAEPW